MKNIHKNYLSLKQGYYLYKFKKKGEIKGSMVDKILILDFGSQFTQLIARRIREMGVYSEILPYSTSIKKIASFGAKGIILSGGPASVYKHFSPKIPREIVDLKIPILGICYGQQLLCKILGGEVKPADKREFGSANITIKKNSALIDGVWEKGKEYPVWMSHGDKVSRIPDDFEIIAKSENAPFAIIANEINKIYGVQFHPEVAHTLDGKKLFQNFVFDICQCKKSWTMKNFMKNQIDKIQDEIGYNHVLCAVSGGVDSSVVAKLLHQAIGSRLHAIFIDHGMMRKNEAMEVKKLFASSGIPLTQIDASHIFLNRLKDVSDPEKKRKIIGVTFIEVFEKEAKKLKAIEYLAQGTLYPDVIESISVHSDASATIKTHHNVGGLPENMNLKLIEPLRSLFKDEVRELGLELGLPRSMIFRHPFPGPGLAIRIIGEVTKEKVRILQEIDDIYIQALREEKLYDKIWQAFAVLLPIQTVGVMGDERTYDNLCAIRAITSIDGMTADIFNFSNDFLRKISTKIINEVKGVNRVVYDITTKPPATIEWE
ncbi:MAG: glutamine-hydrolyzing GMP synthase [Alphaproteobacteria bacterium]